MPNPYFPTGRQNDALSLAQGPFARCLLRSLTCYICTIARVFLYIFVHIFVERHANAPYEFSLHANSKSFPRLISINAARD